MKFSVLLASLLCLCLAGCDSAADFPSAIGRIADRGQPKTRVYSADQKATYEAAKACLEGIDYHFIKGGPAEGYLNAMNTISQGDTPGSSRQMSLNITFNRTLDGKTEVGLLISETNEQNSSNQPGMATQTPVTDTPLYEVFFRALGQKLGVAPTS